MNSAGFSAMRRIPRARGLLASHCPTIKQQLRCASFTTNTASGAPIGAGPTGPTPSSSSSIPQTNNNRNGSSPQQQKKLLPPLTQKQRDFLDQALRVNQAGELGANLIYSGQYRIFRHDPALKPLIRHMWDQEVHHLNTFDTLLAKHRVRPTALRPVWNVAGYLLGLGTAAMGEKAAMACTEAVETEIGGHYNDQVRVLLGMLREEGVEAGLEGLEGGEIKGLLEVIRQFRDDELEHLDTAVDHDSKGADGYEALTTLIRGGCKAAIWISSRI